MAINFLSFVQNVDPALVYIAFLVAFGMSFYQWYTQKPGRKPGSILRPKKANKKLAFEKLEKHTGEFNKAEIITVSENIHVAIGFGLANTIMIEGRVSIISKIPREAPQTIQKKKH
jgi:hypothetical protein